MRQDAVLRELPAVSCAIPGVLTGSGIFGCPSLQPAVP